MDHSWPHLASVLLVSATIAFGYPSGSHERFPESDHVLVNSFSAPAACLVKEFNFTATVTGHNGKRCSGRVTTKACFGSCESSETGTFRFPWVLRVQPVCNYGQVVTRIVRLRHCEHGADRDAAFYRFPEAKSCICERCDPKRQHCEPATTKASIHSGTSDPPSSLGGYSNDSPYQSDSLLLGQLWTQRKPGRNMP